MGDHTLRFAIVLSFSLVSAAHAAEKYYSDPEKAHEMNKATNAELQAVEEQESARDKLVNQKGTFVDYDGQTRPIQVVYSIDAQDRYHETRITGKVIVGSGDDRRAYKIMDGQPSNGIIACASPVSRKTCILISTQKKTAQDQRCGASHPGNAPAASTVISFWADYPGPQAPKNFRCATLPKLPME